MAKIGGSSSSGSSAGSSEPQRKPPVPPPQQQSTPAPGAEGKELGALIAPNPEALKRVLALLSGPASSHPPGAVAPLPSAAQKDHFERLRAPASAWAHAGSACPPFPLQALHGLGPEQPSGETPIENRCTAVIGMDGELSWRGTSGSPESAESSRSAAESCHWADAEDMERVRARVMSGGRSPGLLKRKRDEAQRLCSEAAARLASSGGGGSPALRMRVVRPEEAGGVARAAAGAVLIECQVELPSEDQPAGEGSDAKALPWARLIVQLPVGYPSEPAAALFSSSEAEYGSSRATAARTAFQVGRNIIHADRLN